MTGAYDGRIAMALEQIARDLNLLAAHVAAPTTRIGSVVNHEVRLRSEPA
ncbi:hypothetical protein AIRMID_34 [Mycobacterium phage Airmid]|nr:hypothetical protein AIRMID_34 [Mycobacterium phage Airmid]